MKPTDTTAPRSAFEPLEFSGGDHSTATGRDLFHPMTITPEYLRECLDYDPETGVFTWKERPREHFRTERGWKIFNGTYVGKVVGCPTASGYLQIVISRGDIIGKHFLAHRVAWLFVYGEWPEEHIDHINGVVLDNRIVNLRAATNSENLRNTNTPRTNTSGVKGVRFHKEMKKWHAEIWCDKKAYRLGFYEMKEDAVEAVRLAREKLHGEFANHGEGHLPFFQ